MIKNNVDACIQNKTLLSLPKFVIKLTGKINKTKWRRFWVTLYIGYKKIYSNLLLLVICADFVFFLIFSEAFE